MSARLVVLSGPQAGSVFPITAESQIIGRAHDADLTLVDARLSRRHCSILENESGVHLVDLNSRHGSFVNGESIETCTLTHLDRITLCSSELLFVGSHAAAGRVTFHEEAARDDATEDSLFIKPQPLPALTSAARAARDLATLLQASHAINSLSDPEKLETRLLELCFEIVPAERGAILLVEADSDAITPSVARTSAPNQHEVDVSRTIVKRVLKSRLGLLECDAQERFTGVESVEGLAIRSVVCVPLIVFERLLGVLYLDSSAPGTSFDEHHLQLATAIAALGAVALLNARRTSALRTSNKLLKLALDVDHDLLGHSEGMRRVIELISKVAPHDSSVLVSGESGTGKELVARAIHRTSPRKDGPFVAINCAALPDNLLESELFGHEQGAFTGASAKKLGRLELARGGTLFLDEIGELGMALQPKLLRALQERAFERVGGTTTLKADFRLVTATNRDLAAEAAAGRFREDLFYRLNVVNLPLPPLRERDDDVRALAQAFAARLGPQFGRPELGISEEAMTVLAAYPWPGNVRELENVIERAAVLGSGALIERDDLPETLLEGLPASDVASLSFHTAVNQAKKDVITRAFREAGGSYTEAAKLLELHANSLHRIIRNLGIKEALENSPV